MSAAFVSTVALPAAARTPPGGALVMRAGRPAGGRFRFGSWRRASSGGTGHGGAGAGNNRHGGHGKAGGRGGGGGSGGPSPLGDGAASSGGGGSGSPLAALWTAYNDSLANSPILTKALTSLVGFCLGDILAQSLLGGEGTEFDKARLGRMAAFGFMIHGPVGHYFYGALDRLIPGTELWKVASKVAIDQVAWAPIFTVIFFSFLGALEGKSVDQIKKKVKEDTWKGVTGSWKVWPIVHTINFRFIPTEQRLLYINTIQVAYNVFLSFIGNSEDKKE